MLTQIDDLEKRKVDLKTFDQFLNRNEERGYTIDDALAKHENNI